MLMLSLRAQRSSMHRFATTSWLIYSAPQRRCAICLARTHATYLTGLGSCTCQLSMQLQSICSACAASRPAFCCAHVPQNLQWHQQVQVLPMLDRTAPACILQGLLSLDISHNGFEDSARLASQLAPLQALRQLCVAGNPLCLQRGYQSTLVRSLSKVQSLDGEPGPWKDADSPQQVAARSVSDRTPELVHSSCSKNDLSSRPAQLTISALQLREELLEAASPESSFSAAAATGLPSPPERPEVFYVELTLPNGAAVASIAKRPASVPAPEPPGKGAQPVVRSMVCSA